MVWGARTLAGNDNEWRYINVRRFYNFVEESVKKATQQFVFEPNDANTWVRVSTMIENFLSNLWRQGALAGAAPQDAFFVKVGLDVTITRDDLLNGDRSCRRQTCGVRRAAVLAENAAIIKVKIQLNQ
jgi:phage tail sheath protein FI